MIISVKMAVPPLDKQHSKYLKELEHNYSIRGESEDIGRMPTANHQHGNSLKIKEQKRQKHERELRHFLETREALERFNDILNELQIHIDRLEELKHQSILAQQLIQSGNIEGSIDFLIEYHNLDPNDLAQMHHDEIIAVMLNLERQNQDSIALLKADIKSLAQEAYMIMGEHFDADNPQHQKLMNRLEAMESRAQNLNMDLETIVEHVHVEAGGTFSILEMKMENDDIENDKNISGTFNSHSNNDQSLSKQHNQELQISRTFVQKTVGMNL